MNVINISTGYGPRVLALGTFDGVHLGHRELIRQGKKIAYEIGAVLRVCTFDRHPLEILRPESAPLLLTTAEEQTERLEHFGAEELQVIPFNRKTAETEPEEFLLRLRDECDLKGIVAGWNYSFGRQGRGNADFLIENGAKNGYHVLIVPPVRTDRGEIISSTAVREKLLSGDLDTANAMLGEPYSISGIVVNGKHEGTRIGVPTANIQFEAKKLLPAYGVYACRLSSGEKSWNAVVNIGMQPTIPSGYPTVEAHALGARIQLYGQHARVELLKRLRDEEFFPDTEALKNSIRKDLAEAAAFFAADVNSAR